MKIGTLVKPRRNKGIPIDLISPDIKCYVPMGLNQVGIVIDPLPSSYGTFVRLLVDGRIGDGYRVDFEVISDQ